MAYTTNTFQFLNGTIITPILHSVSVLSLCFNSSMVRLLLNSHVLFTTNNKFQFLNGTIITMNGYGHWRRCRRFQFLNGTIITTPNTMTPNLTEVSIPQWYDYYISAYIFSLGELGFNSSMVRLLQIK